MFSLLIVLNLKSLITLHKIPVVYSVIPDNIALAYIAFLNRDRKFSDNHFYRTHLGARKTLFWLASEYSKLEVHIVESSYSCNMELQFKEVLFQSRKSLLSYISGILLEEDDIIKLLKY